MTSEIMSKTMEINDYLIKVRHHLHQYPELGMKEYETTAFIRKELSDMGIEICSLDVKVGLVGLIKGNKAGINTVTAIRADIDALPILEKTGLPYASKNEGIMHACGHEGHATILLGVAKMLNSMRDQFSGTVKLIFQPGEETLTGAKSMVDAGALENPDVDTIVALHAWPQIETGSIGVWSGPYMASADKFMFKVIGNGGHGAYPHRSKDSLLAATYAVQALNTIISREIDAADKVAISVCTIHGGDAFNIIPEEVVFSGTVRCHDPATRNSIKAKMERIVGGAVATFGCKYELDYSYCIPAVINHPEVIDLIRQSADQALGTGHVLPLPSPVMGSEDFSVFLEKVPYGAFFRLGVAKQGEEEMRVHNNRFDFTDEALPVGVAILTQFVLNKNN
ncbi:MAG: M20 metallopeptidase family protein [Sporomusa sp.]